MAYGDSSSSYKSIRRALTTADRFVIIYFTVNIIVLSSANKLK